MLAVYEFCVDSLEESHFYSDDDIHSNIQAALEQLVLYLHTNDLNNHDSWFSKGETVLQGEEYVCDT